VIRILDRYVARDFLKVFIAALAVLIAISILVNFFEKLYRYVKASLPDILLYYVYTIPHEMVRVAPVALLIAAFLTVGRLSRNFEFLAMQMARLHPVRAVLPIVALAGIMTLGLTFIQEAIAPQASETALRIREQRIRKTSAFHRTRSQDIWYLAGTDKILHIDVLETARGIMENVTLFLFSPEMMLRERLEAAEGRWEKGGWILSRVRIYRFSGGGTDVSVAQVAEMPIQLRATPEDLARVEKKAREMSYTELRRYIRRLSRSGVDARRYVADLFAKPAFLVGNLVMSLLGIALAFRVGRHGLYIHVGTCIGATFLYWFLFSLALPLARNEVLPPLLAVWIPNFFFAGVAVLGLYRSKPPI
jgi:lipopolysaccharide export system permease protein